MRVGRIVPLQEIRDSRSFVLSVTGDRGLWIVGRLEDSLIWVAYCMGRREEFLTYEDALVWVANRLEGLLAEVAEELHRLEGLLVEMAEELEKDG